MISLDDVVLGGTRYTPCTAAGTVLVAVVAMAAEMCCPWVVCNVIYDRYTIQSLLVDRCDIIGSSHCAPIYSEFYASAEDWI
jgi:hypothetical protein